MVAKANTAVVGLQRLGCPAVVGSSVVLVFDMALVVGVVGVVGVASVGCNETVWLLHSSPLQQTMLQSSKDKPSRASKNILKFLQPSVTSAVMKKHQKIIIPKNLSNKILGKENICSNMAATKASSQIYISYLQNIRQYLLQHCDNGGRNREAEIIMRVAGAMDSLRVLSKTSTLQTRTQFQYHNEV